MILRESLVNPYEGYFWIIDDQVVGIAVEVPKNNYDKSQLDGKTHKNTWNTLKRDYLVGGKEVSWDYFPRGRVMVEVDTNLMTGKFENYYCIVFIDKCINSNRYKEMIVDYYNLDLSTVNHISWSMLRDVGIDHYTCYNCRK